MKSQGKRVIVTGASGGIGWETAKLFAAKGATVAAVARRGDRLEQLAKECEGLAGTIVLLVADLSKESEARRMVREGLEKLGGIDILVNNAGVGMYGETAGLDLRLWRQLMEVNYFNVIAAVREATPHLRRAGGGQIINVSTAQGQRAMPGSAAYGSSKAALNALSEALRCELTAENIRVIVVHPGLTQTAFKEHLLQRLPVAQRRSLFWETMQRLRSAVRKGASAAKVARVIVQASEKGRRDAYVSKGDRASVVLARAFPGLTDRVVVGLYGKRR